jgi:hypothetical protein
MQSLGTRHELLHLPLLPIVSPIAKLSKSITVVDWVNPPVPLKGTAFVDTIPKPAIKTAAKSPKTFGRALDMYNASIIILLLILPAG